MAFLETQFPPTISVGSRGGPQWRTVITQTQNGWEQRLQKWSNVKSIYDVGYGVRSISDLHTIRDFFNEMRGRANSFRFKDWLDYTSTDEPLVVSGLPTAQLSKTYGAGFNDYTREIKKPITGLTLKKNTASFTDFTIDITTGIITFTTPIYTGVITAITKAANALITDSSHGLSLGDKVYFTGVAGMVEINGSVGTILTTPDANTYTVDIDSTGFSTYSSSGEGIVYCENGDEFTWTGEYDTPCRFADDFLDFELSTSAIGSTSIQLEEVRL